ncbi:hypothetical protein CROQUDRAFT_651273 [Cronartium quercuum f. sp. fusiforme G11]|uniref:Phosphomevalonate kinase n=1 Tax=Cronartium quercuum f. sp. fusiforme G11 TaxID=708437 RepID=A0A9P6TGW0_9BASI|nr:hypothetical protein CROQUDRAFT_651273 [Cronartium quercuum f. sp. fusiforme G11]
MGSLDQSAQVQTVVSCPAKVLIGGGYLVLNPAYTGTVVATSSRFYAYFDRQIDRNDLGVSRDDKSLKSKKFLLVVRSPQFLNAEWFYLITWSPRQDSDDGDVIVDQLADQNGLTSKNPFLEIAVLESFRLGFALAKARCFESLVTTTSEQVRNLPANTIILLADNDFYSQPRDQSQCPPFNPLDVPITEVHKTGLGSSAAMVTSICGALLLRLAPSLLDGQESGALSRRAKSLIHNLAQYVHSSAQGKIGSGFDISAAVHGTHVYRRFAEECLKIEPDEKVSKGSAAEILALLDPQINPRWTNEATAPQVESFALPPLTTLMLADVDAGSHTPSMVGKVLKWRNANFDEANSLWNNISALNKRLGELCVKLNELFIDDQYSYIAQVQNLSELANIERTAKAKPASQENQVFSAFLHLRSTMQETRTLMRKMGEAADVPIEPPSQTEMLDKCDSLAGVIGSGVPGAGGFDAVWVLVFSPLDSPQIGSENVSKLWNDWTKASIRSLSKDARVEGGQSDRPSGIRIENVEHVKGLTDVLNGTRRMSTVAFTQ